MAYPMNAFQTNTYPANAQPPSSFLVAVTNENQVNNYLVAAGATVAFADINAGLLWLKSTAANGLPEPIRKFEMKEITPQPEPQADANAVTREEFSSMNARIDGLTDKLDKLLSELSGGGKKK